MRSAFQRLEKEKAKLEYRRLVFLLGVSAGASITIRGSV